MSDQRRGVIDQVQGGQLTGLAHLEHGGGSEGGGQRSEAELVQPQVRATTDQQQHVIVARPTACRLARRASSLEQQRAECGHRRQTYRHRLRSRF